MTGEARPAGSEARGASPPRRHDVHVCLVSEQATPNITPVLDSAMRPSQVVMVVSPDMVERASWLENVLRRIGIQAVRWAVDDAWDIEGLQIRIRQLVRETGAHMVLNATGGTKPMSVAAYEVFRDLGKPIFYVHPEQDRIIWLYPAGQPPHPLANRIGLEDFLAAHGAMVTVAARTAQNAARLQRLSEALIADIERYHIPLATINWLSKQAEGTLLSPELSEAQQKNVDLIRLAETFAEAGLLHREGKRIRFPDEHSRSLVNGGWLEQHVYNTLLELRQSVPAIHDLAHRVTVERTAPGGKVTNELDAALLCRNRLYIVECKTSRLESEERDVELGPEALFRLDTLGDLLGGLRATAMLVSYQKLKKATRRRAADLRIRTCCGADLRRLRDALRNWLAGSD